MRRVALRAGNGRRGADDGVSWNNPGIETGAVREAAGWGVTATVTETPRDVDWVESGTAVYTLSRPVLPLASPGSRRE